MANLPPIEKQPPKPQKPAAEALQELNVRRHLAESCLKRLTRDLTYSRRFFITEYGPGVRARNAILVDTDKELGDFATVAVVETYAKRLEKKAQGGNGEAEMLLEKTAQEQGCSKEEVASMLLKVATGFREIVRKEIDFAIVRAAQLFVEANPGMQLTGGPVNITNDDAKTFQEILTAYRNKSPKLPQPADP